MSWNRWAGAVLRGLVVGGLVGVVGCKQQTFLDPADYLAAVTVALPPNLENNAHAAITPAQVDKLAIPATVLDPTRPARYLTLKECIALALEQGNVGSQNPQQFGFKNEQLPTFFQQTNNATDAIRAFAIDPASNSANIERSLSKFDARWINSMTWQKVDQPVAAQFLSFQQQRDAANFSSTLAKPLPTGGVAGITFSVDYSKFGSQSVTQAGFVNPNYTPRVQFVFEQPLLQLFGVEVNQISSTPIQSSLISSLRPSGGQGVDGILITRIRFDQSRAEFERNVNYLLVNVETAYWNLYSSYYSLYAQEEGLRQSYEGFRFTKARVDAGTDPPQQLDQARAQFELFRGQVYTARGQVLESERQLRGLLGLRSDDGQRLVPVDEPNLAQFQPDFYDAANEAMTFRPELLLARQEVKVQQLNVLLQKNLRRPDLRMFSSYDVAGLGTRLDGSELIGANGTTPGNAWSSLGNNQFNSWTLGLRLDMPLGFRDANAQVKQAQLALTRGYVQLRDAELKALEYVSSRYRRVVETYTVISIQRERRQALQRFVERTRVRIEQGTFRSEEYFNFLQVQRDLADAIAREFNLIAQYNSALAEFEFAKGTILRYNNINLGEGPLPPMVQQRAVDHERERVKAILLRERPAADPAKLSPPHTVGPAVGGPALPPLTDMPPAPDLGPNALPAAPNVNPAVPPGSPLPLPSPLPKGNPAVGAGPVAGGDFPDPAAIFTPTGTTVSMPRLQPATVTVPPRGTSGLVPPPASRVPPPVNGPTVPPLPLSSGIPATLPPGMGNGQ